MLLSQVEHMLKQVTQQKNFTPVCKMTPLEYRYMMANLANKYNRQVENVNSFDSQVNGRNGQIPMRIYMPEGIKTNGAILYFQGGGFVDGSLDRQDFICRTLAQKTQTQIFSIVYRLAPENKYPTGYEDTYDATLWLINNIDKYHINLKKIGICGYSSGGTFGAMISKQINRIGLSLACQILICPCLDFSSSFPSREANAKGYLLDKDDIAWHFDHYLPKDVDRKSRIVSPIWDDLSGLPKTLVIGAEYCPFVDENRAYVVKALSVGVDARFYMCKGQIHAMLLFNNTLYEVEQDPLDEVARFFREVIE